MTRHLNLMSFCDTNQVSWLEPKYFANFDLLKTIGIFHSTLGESPVSFFYTRQIILFS